MKRALAIIMAACLALAFAACSGTDTTTTTAAPSNADATTTTAAPSNDDAATTTAAPDSGSGSQALTVWCWDPAFNIYAMNAAAEVYKQDHPDFSLDVQEVPWDDLQTRLTTAATSGDYGALPDIFLMQNNAFQKNAANFPDMFTDLTGKGIPLDDFAASVVAYSTYDGKNLGVPFDNGAAVTALRTDILEEAGYALSDFTDITWSEFIEKGKDVLAKTGKPLLSSVAGESDLTMMALQSCGASLFNEDGTPNFVDNAALNEFVVIYKELVDTGVMINVNNWDEYVGSFVNGTVAGTINGCWILGSVQTAADQSGLWGITNLPKLDTTAGATNFSANGGSSWAVSSNCDNVDLAVDFLNKTFAGSLPFYEEILASSAAIANWLPAADSSVYQEPQEFFGGDAIYEKIMEYAELCPSNTTGVYYYEARDNAALALQKIVAGTDVTTALQEAQDTVAFAMGG